MAATPPTHTAYQVRKYGKEGKGFWTKIGAVWAHPDGQGFNVRLNALPVDGEIVIRSVKEKKGQEDDTSAVEGDNTIPS